MSSAFDPVAALTALVDGGVEFVVIGQLAAVLHGHPESTVDLDVLVRQDLGNAERLVEVLGDLGAVVVAADGSSTGRALEERDLLGWNHVVETDTDVGPVDVVPFAVGVGDYSVVRASAVEVPIDGRSVSVASLDDVIRSKEAAGRPKDLRRIPSLREFRARRPDERSG